MNNETEVIYYWNDEEIMIDAAENKLKKLNKYGDE